MTRLPPSRSNSNAGLIIGLWLGLTLVAGIGIFALIYWAMGGFDAATPAPTALPVAISTTVPPTAPPAAPSAPRGSGGGGPPELFKGMIREKPGPPAAVYDDPAAQRQFVAATGGSAREDYAMSTA